MRVQYVQYERYVAFGDLGFDTSGIHNHHKSRVGSIATCSAWYIPVRSIPHRQRRIHEPDSGQRPRELKRDRLGIN